MNQNNEEYKYFLVAIYESDDWIKLVSTLDLYFQNSEQVNIETKYSNIFTIDKNNFTFYRTICTTVCEQFKKYSRYPPNDTTVKLYKKKNENIDLFIECKNFILELLKNYLVNENN